MKMRFSYDSSAVLSAPQATWANRIYNLLSAAMAAPRLWSGRHRERHALLQLDDHMLRDIGFDRVQADEMAARPFWRK